MSSAAGSLTSTAGSGYFGYGGGDHDAGSAIAPSPPPPPPPLVLSDRTVGSLISSTSFGATAHYLDAMAGAPRGWAVKY